MLPEKASAIKAHAEAIAALLYEESDPEQLTTLAGIEKTVRDQVLEGSVAKIFSSTIYSVVIRMFQLHI